MQVRQFETGATKSSDAGKPNYHAILSPLVIHRYGEYMNKHRLQPDGSLRQPDNWKKGIPQADYFDSMHRHFLDLWLHHDGFSSFTVEDYEESLTALYFNVQGYLHEILKEKYAKNNQDTI